MFKHIMLICIAVLMVSCGDQTVEPIKPTRNETSWTMTVNFIKESEIQDFCSKLGVSYHANGCTAFNLETKHCNVYVVEPNYLEDQAKFTVLGHETLHCKYGKWHK